MHDKKFNLIAIQLVDLQTGEPIFKETLWLTVWGDKRNDLSLQEIYQAFRLRFDIEFFFRFSKQRLLLDKFQTPDVEHLQNWFHILQLAYWLLYLSRNQGELHINKWEKYLPKNKDQDVKEPINQCTKTPTQTQRAMPQIIGGFVKTSLIPKTRNNSSGRKKGEKQIPRIRYKVFKKAKK